MNGAPAGPSRGYALASVLFIAGALALAAPWLLGVVTIPWDAKAEAWPQFAFLARSLAAGESPFWTPNTFLGHPHIADPQALIFSPSFLAMALLGGRPDFIAADAVVFAMLILGGLSLMMFFRDRGWRAEGALVAAFAFAFGCSAAWRLQHVGQVTSLCWFAMALTTLSRALDRRSVGWGFASGVVAGFMALGRDQVGLLCAYALAILVVWFLIDGEGRLTRLRRALAPLAGGFVGGVIVTAIPIAFSLALATESNRPAIDFAGAGRGSMPPMALLTGVVANLFGVDGPFEKFWGPPSPAVWGENDLALARNMAEIYFGALPLAAIVCLGLARGAARERGAAIFAFLTVVMGLYTVGRYTPFFALVFHLPGVDFYRRPADATFPFGAMLAILGGYCVHRAFATPARLKPSGLLMFGGLFAACVFVAADRGHLAQATPALITGFVFLATALAALMTLPALSTRHPAAALALLAVVMTLDLATNNKPNESTGLPPQTYEELRFGTRNETITLLKRKLAETAASDRRDRVELAGLGFEWPNAGLIHDLDNDLGYNPVRLKLYTDATHALDQVAEMNQRMFSPLFPSYHSPMANLMGLRWIATGAPPATIDKALKPGDLRLVARTADGFVNENPDALPRVLLPTHAMPADFARLLVDGGMPDIDYRSNVLLDPASPEARADLDAADKTVDAAPGKATILAYHNTEIEIAASAPQGGYVVLNDIWHPWWRAEVDGQPTPILRANVTFRAVRVPPGEHRVRFTFHPFLGLWRFWTGSRQSGLI
jgi:hypothetical protein